MSRVDIALTELWQHWVDLSLGSPLAGLAPDEPAAAVLQKRIEKAHERRKAGQLDEAAFLAWACGQVPWLARQLGDAPEPPRRVWTPPPPPVPAPSPAHAAVAARIVRSG
jgi:hypothetical protein